eukprot:TRINITY_DN1306_c0_g1_i3.p1 TRINITY_DN1306_c0_g1~~TRINITY_DN1306_c0_g1_i3.p1  ORF type:complete len:142 (+),score=10.93 TRINITY_DN1306_c0_g1_i3:190-615(+)
MGWMDATSELKARRFNSKEDACDYAENTLNLPRKEIIEDPVDSSPYRIIFQSTQNHELTSIKKFLHPFLKEGEIPKYRSTPQGHVYAFKSEDTYLQIVNKKSVVLEDGSILTISPFNKPSSRVWSLLDLSTKQAPIIFTDK